MREKLPPMTMSHIGIVVKDLERMEAFYTGVLGLQETDRGIIRGQPIVFLSREAGEHHQIVLQEKRQSEESTINQISFRLDDLDALRRIHRILVAAGVKEMQLVDHCVSWSVYCHDPEGNRLEFFVDAPYYVHQPIIQPLDLDRSDEEIQQATRERFSDDPTFNSFEAWKSGFAEKLAGH
jgi:catechol 2,3-dioxygenase